MTTTSTGAWASATAASRPPKPAPTITTCGRDRSVIGCSLTRPFRRDVARGRESARGPRLAALFVLCGSSTPSCFAASVTTYSWDHTGFAALDAPHHHDLEYQLCASARRSRRQIHQGGAARRSVPAGNQVPG